MRNNKSNDLEMHVIKRNGKKEVISFDKILKRIKSLGSSFLALPCSSPLRSACPSVAPPLE